MELGWGVDGAVRRLSATVFVFRGKGSWALAGAAKLRGGKTAAWTHLAAFEGLVRRRMLVAAPWLRPARPWPATWALDLASTNNLVGVSINLVEFFLILASSRTN